ncbi:MAG: hypothetical protein ACRDGQ_14805 [Candidatus Limnocylindrales bacterium]
MDRGAAIRVRAAIEATLREQGSYPTYAATLTEAEGRFRLAIRELVKGDEPLGAEFEALFPAATRPTRPAGAPGRDRFDGGGSTKNARTHLTAMSNWLLGLIDSEGNSRP